ncbi:zf-HC2 domain-containing protein [Candidatus Omnitrophota bacterium]
MKIKETRMSGCPSDAMLSDYLTGGLSQRDKGPVENHIADCDKCLTDLVSCYESVKEFEHNSRKRRSIAMNKINWYLISSITAFFLSFAFREYFLQFLAAAVILAVKWIVDAKNTRILITIYEAWKKGGEKEASKILKGLDVKTKDRF